VYSLKSFSAEKSNFALEADLQVSGSDIKLEYALSDRGFLFQLPGQTQKWSSDAMTREEELWKHTCFEAFLNPVGFPLYFEFNFSLKSAWNCYQFERYRYPQPPKVCWDFVLKSIVWDEFEGKLKIHLENRTQYKKFKVGLTAVLEEKSGLKHYCALAHKGTQPDFHLLDSFTLIR
jgi:hypothetical protein